MLKLLLLARWLLLSKQFLFAFKTLYFCCWNTIFCAVGTLKFAAKILAVDRLILLLEWWYLCSLNAFFIFVLLLMKSYFCRCKDFSPTNGDAWSSLKLSFLSMLMICLKHMSICRVLKLYRLVTFMFWTNGFLWNCCWCFYRISYCSYFGGFIYTILVVLYLLSEFPFHF